MSDIPFNLEAAKAGKAIVCRNGSKAVFIAYVPEFRTKAQVIYRIEGNTGPNGCAIDGISDWAAGLDLLMAPETRTVWVNVWEGSGGIFTTSRTTRKEADAESGLKRIACFEKTFTVGERL